MASLDLSLVDALKLAWRLFRLGFLSVQSAADLSQVCPEKLHSSLESYRRFHGLEGQPEDALVAHLFAPRFCGHPDVLPLLDQRGGVCRWDRSDLRVCVTGHLPGLTDQQYLEAVRLALSWWEEVSGLRFTLVREPQQCDILLQTGAIPGDGGPGGVLAQSELPCGHGGRRLAQLYDNRERWVVSEQMTGGQIDLARVAAHELGHALGLGHTDVPRQLMNPFVSAQIRKPQPQWDVAEILKRYPKQPDQPGPPAQTPGEPLEYRIKFPRPVSEIVVRVTG